jgi:superfamily II DNA/RNA helicase
MGKRSKSRLAKKQKYLDAKQGDTKEVAAKQEPENEKEKEKDLVAAKKQKYLEAKQVDTKEVTAKQELYNEKDLAKKEKYLEAKEVDTKVVAAKQEPENKKEKEKKEEEDERRPNKRLKTPKHATSEIIRSSELTHCGLHVSFQGSGKSIIPGPLELEAETKSQSEENLCKVWRYIGNSSANKEWNPAPVQCQAWAILLKRLPLVGISPTGSGKTLAYAIPTLVSGATTTTSILILAPTRELVHQISKVCSKVSNGLRKTCSDLAPTRIISIHGGVNREAQQKDLERVEGEVQVVVSTPGRLLDLLDANETILECMKSPSWIVLDEADQLAKEGDLGPQVDRILELLRTDNTTLALVSATYPEKVHSKFREWVGPEHVLVKVDSLDKEQNKVKTEDSSGNAQQLGAEGEEKGSDSFGRIPPHLTQVLHVCAEHKKARKLVNTLQTIRKEEQGRNHLLGIVFFGRIEKLKYVSKLLLKEDVKCVELHSQLPNHVREMNLHLFSTGKVPLILATDLAARGIHVTQVRFVIQYDFPGNLNQYIHRCGRAGRSGNPSKVYSFFTRNLQPMAPDLVKLLEANRAWVDPNLRALVLGGDGDQPANEGKRKRSRRKAVKAEVVRAERDGSDGSSDDDDFPELAPNRIVLKRAGHVSDASSDRSEDDSD